MRQAVLVIDVQQGLCEGEGAVFDSAGVIARINTVTRRARAAGVAVIVIQHESGPGYLEHGTAAWQSAHGLEVQPGDHRVRKTTPDAFLRTSLAPLLQELGVQELVVCGMHTEFCVDTTTRQALARGYPVVLIADGHTSAGNPALDAAQVIAHHNHTLANIESFGPRVRPVSAADYRPDAGSTISSGRPSGSAKKV
ncbi:cysteine hydrolase family protein [Amphibiibacter pelophylacis]|uniref:Cysteine hydrolase family protein n=1 Tax=Amphibiibacter pelophylacis TaxID=1799477 RepID=A0ACC6P2Y8_9BURK